MHVQPTDLPDVLVIEPKIFGDARGYFVETWQSRRYAEAGLPATLVQDNLSKSAHGVLRGLHYQYPQPQAKLVYALEGEVLDVAVDVRQGSPTFGRCVTVQLTGESKRQVFVPAGFAHGFCVVSPTAVVAYKCSTEYAPQYDRGVRWNDDQLAIDWPIKSPTLSDKDAKLPLLRDIAPELLPKFAAV